MKNYVVICVVSEINFATNIVANSATEAEHIILDLGYTGKHTYGVTACQAYSEAELKTEWFIGSLMSAQMVSYEELTKIIEKRNEVIKKSDYAEKRITEIKKEMKALENEMKALENDIM